VIRKFWWGSKEGKRKTAWVAWDSMVKSKSLGGLGFRNMELFNLALLAKQGWRLLKDPSSLSARILKAVYFPNTEFLEAELGSSPSRVWRSITDGREVLKEGLIKRIGTGASTPIWSTNWLPAGNLRRPIPTDKPNAPHLVSELIDATEARWNISVLNEFFSPLDVDTILSIPISTRIQEDFWAWHYEKKGVFTVRSAYHMIIHKCDQVDSADANRSERSDQSAMKKEWKSLWAVKVPSKINMFLWRLARHSLPTNDVRHHRHMADSSACYFCGQQDSWRHSLLECNVAKCIWALEDEQMASMVSTVDDPCAKGWLAQIFRSLNNEEAVRCAVVLWAIWYARRKAIHESVFQSPLSTHSFIQRFMADLSVVQTQRHCPDSSKQRTGPSLPAQCGLAWCAPPLSVVKINVDAGLAKNGGKVAAAAIARNTAGDFLGASVLVLKGLKEPEIVEAIACREGLALAQDIQVTRVRLACDNANVISSINQGSNGVYGQIVKEIQEESKSLESVEFIHERRSTNIDAHRIARSSLYEDEGRHVWFLYPPYGVCNSYADAS